MGRPRRSSASLAVDNADAVAPQVSRNHPQSVKPFPGIPDRPQEILLPPKLQRRGLVFERKLVYYGACMMGYYDMCVIGY